MIWATTSTSSPHWSDEFAGRATPAIQKHPLPSPVTPEAGSSLQSAQARQAGGPEKSSRFQEFLHRKPGSLPSPPVWPTTAAVPCLSPDPDPSDKAARDKGCVVRTFFPKRSSTSQIIWPGSIRLPQYHGMAANKETPVRARSSTNPEKSGDVHCLER